MSISFRRVIRDDLPLVHEWHQRPHVVRWWNVRKTFQETEGHYLPTIDGTEPTQHYLALLDDEPLGMVQTYLVSDYPDYAALIEEGEGTAGLDLFIGDEALTGRGLGTEMIRRSSTRSSSRGRRRRPARLIRPSRTPPHSERSRKPASGPSGSSSTRRTMGCTRSSGASGIRRRPLHGHATGRTRFGGPAPPLPRSARPGAPPRSRASSAAA
jgi:hypothetical protein